MSENSEPFEVYPEHLLPDGFRYPAKYLRLAATGDYPDIYPWWFISAGSEMGKLSHALRMRDGSALIAFAKVDNDDNDIACFDGTDTSGNPNVIMKKSDPDSVGRDYKDFHEWFEAALAYKQRLRG